MIVCYWMFLLLLIIIIVTIFKIITVHYYYDRLGVQRDAQGGRVERDRRQFIFIFIIISSIIIIIIIVIIVIIIERCAGGVRRAGSWRGALACRAQSCLPARALRRRQRCMFILF